MSGHCKVAMRCHQPANKNIFVKSLGSYGLFITLKLSVISWKKKCLVR